MTASEKKEHKTLTRSAFLENASFFWEVFENRSGGRAKWWTECRTEISRRAADDIEKRGFSSLEEAKAEARKVEAARLRSHMEPVYDILRPKGFMRLPFAVWRALSRARRERVELCLKIEKEVLQRLADSEAGRTEFRVWDIKEVLREAGRLPVGTQLWVVSMAFPFDEGAGPAIIEAEVSDVEPDLCVYEGSWRAPDRPEVNYHHTVTMKPRKGSWDGPEGSESECDFELVGDERPDELPWQVHGERLFLSREAAEKCLLEMAERCRQAVTRGR